MRLSVGPVLVLLLVSLALANVTAFAAVAGLKRQGNTNPNNTCSFGPSRYAPLANKRMDQCCWYRDSTCCDSTVGNRFVFPKVREELRTVSYLLKPGGDCFLAVADFLCLPCNPVIGNFVQKVDDIEYSLKLCDSFCDSMWQSCKNEPNISRLFPTAPAQPSNSSDFCTMLFNAEAANDVPEFKFRSEIVPSGPGCFNGNSKQAVSCSGCVPDASACPVKSRPPITKDPLPLDPTPKPVQDTSLGGTVTIALGVVAVALLVIGAIVAIIVFVRRRGPPVPRGRDYFPKLDDEDTGSLTS